LFGVKTTLNKLAVKLELSWQALREFDSINLMADTLEKKDRRAVKMTRGEDNEDLIMADVYRRMRSRVGGCTGRSDS
jgi:hypothetical protein